uniref:Potassium channel domain-containing protein n=1 Tax=Setaria digitata TaxID=48799 RepID=A0A915PBA0_9BILA
MAGWKKYARIILPHVGLIILSLLYTIGGALAFYHLERPNEIAVRRESLKDIFAQKKLMLDELWIMLNDDSISDEEIERLAIHHVDNVTRILFEAFDTHYISASHLRTTTAMTSSNDSEAEEEEYSWTFTTALFFTATLLTTIGYGNLVPVTFQGRMFCIVYALFGVPLILITVADIGKFLSENIIWLYAKYREAKKMYKEKKTVCITSVVGEISGNVKDQLLQFGLEQYISIPVPLVVGMLLGYIAVGAILLASWEHWDFFSGFYFSFITVTTVSLSCINSQISQKLVILARRGKDVEKVGFGDIVPVKHEYFLFDLFYIVVGLAITTMCIDLVGIQYIRKIHYFGRAIKDARYALVNVGGRMVHVPDLMRYASVLHQKYGQKRQGHQMRLKGAYTPEDLPLIRYIDYGSLASEDSRLHFFTNIFSKSNELSTV